jgi:hypothetical protein
MNIIKSKRLCSALYAQNPVWILIQDRLDAVHKARQVGKKGHFNIQINLIMDIYFAYMTLICIMWFFD